MKHILNILAAWRLMELFRDEDGPFDILEQFRTQIQYDAKYKDKSFVQTIEKEIDEALKCGWCLSVWIGFFVALITGENLIWGFAYSAGAIMIKGLRDLPIATWIRIVNN